MLSLLVYQHGVSEAAEFDQDIENAVSYEANDVTSG